MYAYVSSSQQCPVRMANWNPMTGVQWVPCSLYLRNSCSKSMSVCGSERLDSCPSPRYRYLSVAVQISKTFNPDELYYRSYLLYSFLICCFCKENKHPNVMDLHKVKTHLRDLVVRRDFTSGFLNFFTLQYLLWKVFLLCSLLKINDAISVNVSPLKTKFSTQWSSRIYMWNV